MLLTAKVPTPTVEDELTFILKELEPSGNIPYIPMLFLRYAVETIRTLRVREHLDVAPATPLSAAMRSKEIAFQEGLPVVTYRIITDAVSETVLREAKGREQVSEKIFSAFPDVRSYLCHCLQGIDMVGIAHALKIDMQCRCNIGALLRRSILEGRDPQGLDLLTVWVAQHERMRYYQLYEVIAAYLDVFLL
ncbi:MAG: hypothetical protein N3B18_12525 [Desulfobacterota bacterium]|nr:hypothetical protein [Thermodesulfobacteriota bacterium]